MHKLLHHAKETFGVLIRHQAHADFRFSGVRHNGFDPGALVTAADPVHLKGRFAPDGLHDALDIVAAQCMQSVRRHEGRQAEARG